MSAKWGEQSSSDEGSVGADADDRGELSESEEQTVEAAETAPESGASAAVYRVEAPAKGDPKHSNPRYQITDEQLTVFISHIDFSATEKDVVHELEGEGCRVASFSLSRQYDGRSRGQGVAKLADINSLKKCLGLSGRPILGSKLYVKLDERRGREPREERRDVQHNSSRRPASSGFDRLERTGGGRQRIAEKLPGGRGISSSNAVASMEEAPMKPASRPKLVLNPRSLPVETIGAVVSTSDIFGGAKPRDEIIYEEKKKLVVESVTPSMEAVKKDATEPKTSTDSVFRVNQNQEPLRDRIPNSRTFEKGRKAAGENQKGMIGQSSKRLDPKSEKLFTEPSIESTQLSADVVSDVSNLAPNQHHETTLVVKPPTDVVEDPAIAEASSSSIAAPASRVVEFTDGAAGRGNPRRKQRERAPNAGSNETPWKGEGGVDLEEVDARRSSTGPYRGIAGRGGESSTGGGGGRGSIGSGRGGGGRGRRDERGGERRGRGRGSRGRGDSVDVGQYAGAKRSDTPEIATTEQGVVAPAGNARSLFGEAARAVNLIENSKGGRGRTRKEKPAAHTPAPATATSSNEASMATAPSSNLHQAETLSLKAFQRAQEAIQRNAAASQTKKTGGSAGGKNAFSLLEDSDDD